MTKKQMEDQKNQKVLKKIIHFIFDSFYQKSGWKDCTVCGPCPKEKQI